MDLLEKLTLQVLNDPGSIDKCELEQIKLHELCEEIAERFVKNSSYPFTNADKETAINISAFTVMFMKTKDYTVITNKIGREMLLMNESMLRLIHTSHSLWKIIFDNIRCTACNEKLVPQTYVKIDLCNFGIPVLESKSTKLKAASLVIKD